MNDQTKTTVSGNLVLTKPDGSESDYPVAGLGDLLRLVDLLTPETASRSTGAIMTQTMEDYLELPMHQVRVDSGVALVGSVLFDEFCRWALKNRNISVSGGRNRFYSRFVEIYGVDKYQSGGIVRFKQRRFLKMPKTGKPALEDDLI